MNASATTTSSSTPISNLAPTGLFDCDSDAVRTAFLYVSARLVSERHSRSRYSTLRCSESQTPVM